MGAVVDGLQHERPVGRAQPQCPLERRDGGFLARPRDVERGQAQGRQLIPQSFEHASTLSVTIGLHPQSKSQ